MNTPTLPKSNSLPSIATMPYHPSATRSLDNCSSSSSNNNIQDTLYRKVADRLQQYNVSVSGDMDKLLLQNRQLNEGEISIEQEYRALNDVKERLKYNNMVLETRSKELDQVTEQVNGLSDVDVDEALCGTTVVANQ
jgi:ESCRT-I complex subunit TSG101